ncbi:MobA-like NTP transferase domain-containing protein [Roseovarius marisflavi]|uniref:MobA-like NTP transferase domain-containing protein n=1 Tax=Roseovarius marisflavi TaxID=1054996 RepID=A0A1M6WXZ6_9RHOB|nr:nucleotidyltransferase family protein [Roseovarius marisflavi]SHK98435.1 MobA-like NTP transferase domain-containing protein [Roseovarius marisflavi]
MTASPDQSRPVQVLVLAGARAAGDPLCDAEGVASKAVIDIVGQPMLSRVLRALGASRADAPAWVLGLEGAALEAAADGIPCQPLASQGRGPASSLIRALEGPISTPLLVTTCDHALLTPAMVDSFLAKSIASDADMTVGFAERSVIEAEYPETKRTYLRLGGAELSGCNLFYLASPAALKVIRFWQSAEQDRKKPWRIAWRFGPLTALRILLMRSGHEAAFALLSRQLGVRVAPVLLPFAEAAIDVDKPGDLVLVREILTARDA